MSWNDTFVIQSCVEKRAQAKKKLWEGLSIEPWETLRFVIHK